MLKDENKLFKSNAANASLEFYQLSKQYMEAVLNRKSVPHNLIKNAKKLVLESGANPGYVHKDDSSPIKKINFNKTSFKGLIGRTALMNYVAAGNVEMVDFILQHGGAFSINARDWQWTGFVTMFAPWGLEKAIAKEFEISGKGMFTSALSLAVTSRYRERQDYIMRTLLEHGADARIFADDEYYRPILFMYIGELDNDRTYARVSSDHRKKVEILVKAMEVDSLHTTTYKRTHHVLTKMLNGWKFTHHRGMPMPGPRTERNIFSRTM